MSKRRLTWTQAKFEQYLKEGRGQGTGSNYKPWITAQDFPTEGRLTRSLGWKSGRLHHLFSDHETRYFYLLEWSEVVVDIREQFPLIDVAVARRIAQDMGVQYPTDSASGTPYVMTTDFMISLDEFGKKSEIARTIKPSSKLSERRVIEKFEIERRYWEAQGIDWGIVTEKDIPKVLVRNLEWLYPAYRLETSPGVAVAELLSIAAILKDRLRSSSATISKITTALDREMNLEIGTALSIFRHLVARKEIVLDMDKKIEVCQSAKNIIEIRLDSSYEGALA